MAEENQQLNGSLIEIEALQNSWARAFVRTITHEDNAFVNLINCLSTEAGLETVVFEISVEVPQDRVHDIRPVEPMAVSFIPENKTIPEIVALRPDFPRIAHTNLRFPDFPVSLCVYESNHDEVRQSWSPHDLLLRIATWLSKAAVDGLHAEGQPLEPFLETSLAKIVLPNEVYETNTTVFDYTVYSKEEGRQQTFFLDKESEARHFREENKAKMRLLCLTTPTVRHGVINYQPRSLNELHELLSTTEYDLHSFLAGEFRNWQMDAAFSEYEKELMLLVRIPLSRNEEDQIEFVSIAVFYFQGTIYDIGRSLSVWERSGGSVGLIMNASAPDTSSINAYLLNPVPRYSKEIARSLNNIVEPQADAKFVMVGAGALGSSILSLVARSGFGTWNVIDNDVLLPHNIARHSLHYTHVGWSKADVLCDILSDDLGDKSINPIHANVIHPGDNREKVSSAINGCDVIVDCAASVAVQRYLSDSADKNTFTTFIAPNTTDLVIFTRAKRSESTTTDLEYQYYRWILSQGEFADHLKNTAGFETVGSCREASVKIENEIVSALSALSVKCLKTYSKNPKDSISILRINEDGSILRFDCPVFPTVRATASGWNVIYDQHVEEKLEQERLGVLPNETGGIIVGSINNHRKTIHVVDVQKAPPDSVPNIHSFVRGKEGNLDLLELVNRTTSNKVGYIGEWHTHGDHPTSDPSGDDIAGLAEMSQKVLRDAMPGFMMIHSKGGTTSLINDELLGI